jgi:hypothetical protein
MNVNAMIVALFLPLLYWTGTVIAVTLFGYPGVVCMTPMAWLLALPVGFRLARESSSPPPILRSESLVTGGVLGLWQGLLLAVAMVLAPAVSNYGEDLPASWLAALAGVLVSTPVTAGLAALAAWWARRGQAAQEHPDQHRGN